MDKPPARIRAVRLPNDPFLQSNGYKPAPLDLSAIELTAKMEELVDLLAENTHNLWAKERISQGWTYGLNEVRLYIRVLLLAKQIRIYNSQHLIRVLLLAMWIRIYNSQHLIRVPC